MSNGSSYEACAYCGRLVKFQTSCQCACGNDTGCIMGRVSLEENVEEVKYAYKIGMLNSKDMDKIRRLTYSTKRLKQKLLKFLITIDYFNDNFIGVGDFREIVLNGLVDKISQQPRDFLEKNIDEAFATMNMAFYISNMSSATKKLQQTPLRMILG